MINSQTNVVVFCILSVSGCLLYGLSVTDNLNVYNPLATSNHLDNLPSSAAVGNNNYVYPPSNNIAGTIENSMAVGNYNRIYDTNQFAVGYNNALNSKSQVTMGEGLYGPGDFGGSSAGGNGPDSQGSVIVGRYNATWGSGAYPKRVVFGVGNGVSQNERKNAFVVYHDGDIWLGNQATDGTGNVTIGSDSGTVTLRKVQGDISMGEYAY